MDNKFIRIEDAIINTRYIESIETFKSNENVCLIINLHNGFKQIKIFYSTERDLYSALYELEKLLNASTIR